MKSGLASALIALEAINREGIALEGDLLFGGVVGIWIIPDRPRVKPPTRPLGYRIELGPAPGSFFLSNEHPFGMSIRVTRSGARIHIVSRMVRAMAGRQAMASRL